MNPTPEQIEDAKAILKAAEAVDTFPKGSHLISTFDCLGETQIIINSSGHGRRDVWRELSPAELDLFRTIPEMKKALGAK